MPSVKHSCGCIIEYPNHGGPRAQQRFVHSASKDPCYRCKIEQARYWAGKRMLPNLCGTPAQVDWAEVIRAHHLSQMEKWLDHNNKKQIEAYQTYSRKTVSSVVWIKWRRQFPAELLKNWESWLPH